MAPEPSFQHAFSRLRILSLSFHVNGLVRIQKGMWWLQQDPHSADGLRFHWGGSQSNRSLLRCLGVGAENTVSLKLSLSSAFENEVTDERRCLFFFVFVFF